MADDLFDLEDPRSEQEIEIERETEQQDLRDGFISFESEKTLDGDY